MKSRTPCYKIAPRLDRMRAPTDPPAMPNPSTLLLWFALGLLAAVLAAGALYGNWALREHRLTVITPNRVYQSAVMPPDGRRLPRLQRSACCQ